MRFSSYHRSFDSKVRSRGIGYADDDSTFIRSYQAGGRISADVYGSDDYLVDVNVARQPGRWVVHAECTCPYVAEYGEPCKHIYAVLVLADRRGYFDHAPSEVVVSLADEWDGDPFFEDGPDSDIATASPERGRLSSPSARNTPQKTTKRNAKPTVRPAWEGLIDRLAASVPISSATQPTAGPIAPIYVLWDDGEGGNAMLVSLLGQDRLKSGGLGAPKALALTPDMITRLADDRDRSACLMMIGANEESSRGYYQRYYGRANYSTQFQIPGDTERSILPLMAESGRLYFCEDRVAEGAALTLDADGPWQLVLQFDSVSTGHALTAHLRRGKRVLQIDSLRHLFCHYAIVDKTIIELADGGAENWIGALRQLSEPLIVRAGERDQFLQRLAQAPALPPVDWPADWSIEPVQDQAPQPILVLMADSDRLSGSSDRSAIYGEIRFAYGDLVVEWSDPRPTILDVEGRRQVVRGLAAEELRLAELRQAELERDPYRQGFLVPYKRALVVVEKLLASGWEVLGKELAFRQAGSFDIEATSGIDWFELNGSVQFGDTEAKLPDLLQAWRKGESFVKLDNGELGMMPVDWLAQHAALLDMGRADRDGRLKFNRAQIGVLDMLLAQMPEARFDQSLGAARKKLAKFDGIKPRLPRKYFDGELRDYQRLGLGWLSFLRDLQWGGCLADDMGLGKTVQVLALLDKVHARKKDVAPSLLVVPNSLLFNWMREAERFTPRLRMLNYTGVQRAAFREAFDEHDVVMTTYGTLRRDVKTLSERRFNYLILDEAQAIKNPKAAVSKACRLLQGEVRLAMTGTPVENRLADLWSIFEFLNPGLLGTHDHFCRSYVPKASARTNGHGATAHNHQGEGADQALDRNLRQLHQIVRPFLLRRTKEQVAPELPARSEQIVECDLPARQRKLYNDLLGYYRAMVMGHVKNKGLGRSKMHVLEALLRLRQAACHPALIDQKHRRVSTGKLETLVPMIEELVSEGHKALVFSQFTSMLALVRDAFDRRKWKYEYLDGKTRDRSECVDRFQGSADVPLFLISLKAGGTGLNLTAADYVFILDPWWNPAVEAQAIDRTHRIGQDKQVIAYRLIARDTVEAKILELQERKRELAGAIMTESNSLISDLTKDDLAMLFA